MLKIPVSSLLYLDVICVAGTVDVTIVPVVGGVLDCGRVDRDSSLLLLRILVNIFVRLELGELSFRTYCKTKQQCFITVITGVRAPCKARTPREWILSFNMGAFSGITAFTNYTCESSYTL